MHGLHKNGVLQVLAMASFISACAHAPDTLKLDRSSGLNLVPIAARSHASSCRVSVQLTQEQAIRHVEQWNVPHPESMPGWIALVEAIQPGDQLRAVICVRKGNRGGTDYLGLFRDGVLVTEFQYVIID